mgnify:CR=1 FL=1
MYKSKIGLYAIIAVLGTASVYMGGFVFTGEALKSLSGLCIGLGAALFCLGIGNLIGAGIISKVENEELVRKKNIEMNDERNTRIREKVGAQINRIVVYALTVIVLALGFMGTNVMIIIMISSVLLLELVLAITLSSYYSKRM